VVVQMPCADRELLFVASSERDCEEADQEIVDWAADNGYLASRVERVYRLYSPETAIRDWRLLERFSA